MRVISRKRLREFAAAHKGAAEPLAAWYAEAVDADWTTPHDVKAHYRNASIVRECAVFNIAGNKFRLVTWINYRRRLVYIKAVFTHREYDEAAIDCRRAE